MINWNQVGTAMLQDAIWANTDQAEGPGVPGHDGQVPDRELRGLDLLRGARRPSAATWSCKAGSKLGASHQLWQTNEVNKLIWPSPQGIGMVDTAAWNRTVTIAENTKNADGQTVLTGDAEGRGLHQRLHRARRWPS